MFREVFEREIAKELDAKSAGIKQLMNKDGSNNIKMTLADELNEGETQLTKKMREEKAEFIKKFQKHQIKSKDEDFEKALLGKEGATVNVISVAKQKRENEDDLE